MKKRLWFGLCAILFAGCASTSRQASYYIPEIVQKPFVYEVRNVYVNIDYVEDAVIADQFNTLLITELSAQETQITDKENVYPVNDVIYLTVEINQRSFIQDIQQKNSIYIIFTGYDKNGNILIRENSYFAGKENFISSVDQYKCSKKIIANLLSYQKKVNIIFLKK